MDSQHLTERKNNAYNIYGLSESDPLPPRFTVFNSAFYNGDTLHETPELIATNNFNELLDFVEATGINQIDKKLNERENKDEYTIIIRWNVMRSNSIRQAWHKTHKLFC
jgi:hypothetical protein